MPTEQEILENLLDAGCDAPEAHEILTSLQAGDRRRAERLIAESRRKLLSRLHESQQCIDRLDYLSRRLSQA